MITRNAVFILKQYDAELLNKLTNSVLIIVRLPLYSKRIYSANGISRSFFPHISAFSRHTKMHLNGMFLIGTEFFKIIVPL